MNAPLNKAEVIASLNDRFRSSPVPSGVPGVKTITNGIIALSGKAHSEVWKAVQDYADFTEDNDPNGTHDFGEIDHPEAGKVFWTIDVFATDRRRLRSAHPEDPQRSYRVLTIMLAEEC